MAINDSLGDRMKRYEEVSKTSLMRRTPVIIRIDGKAFHTFTKRLKRLDPDLTTTPFSTIMRQAMSTTTKTLLDKVQNCVFGYTQSDEISLLLRDYDKLTTEAWFDNNVQKMVSVSSSIATAAFNSAFFQYQKSSDFSDMAMFDARVYNIPKEEVANYFVWRQQDAIRNSVQMLGHYHMSPKQMHGLTNAQVQERLREINHLWEDVPLMMQRGLCVYRTEQSVVTDTEIPVFAEDRKYVNRHVLPPSP